MFAGGGTAGALFSGVDSDLFSAPEQAAKSRIRGRIKNFLFLGIFQDSGAKLRVVNQAFTIIFEFWERG